MKDDLVNLLSLVALLISTAGFKEELSSVKLGDTDFTLFTIFSIASIIFGGLLYIHLLINGSQLLRQAWREKKKIWSLVILRFSFVVMLAIIPLGSAYVGVSNWLYTERCSQEYISEDPLDPFGFTYASDGTGETKLVCWSPLSRYVIPLFIMVPITLVAWYFIFRSEREYFKLSPKAKIIVNQITNLRIMQATSSSIEKNSLLEAEITKLQEQLMMENKSRDKK